MDKLNSFYLQILLAFISINAFTQSRSSDTDILKPVKTEGAIIIDGKLNEPFQPFSI